MTKKSRLLELGRLWGIYSRTRCLPVEKEVGTVITWWQLLVVNVNKKSGDVIRRQLGLPLSGDCVTTGIPKVEGEGGFCQ